MYGEFLQVNKKIIFNREMGKGHDEASYPRGNTKDHKYLSIISTIFLELMQHGDYSLQYYTVYLEVAHHTYTQMVIM